jgi:hypothetical protein
MRLQNGNKVIMHVNPAAKDKNGVTKAKIRVKNLLAKETASLKILLCAFPMASWTSTRRLTATTVFTFAR